MRNNLRVLIGLGIGFSPLMAISQVTDTTAKKHAVDSAAMKADSTMKMDSLAPKTTVDTVRVVVDTVAKKDCYTEYYDVVRSRGAKKVTDGMQQVVIALKSADGCHCLLGQIEVSGGKIKPPLYFQQESGEYRAVSTVGKKLEPAFISSMTPDELYSIKEGMSIVFRTADNEYGRLFFYKFVNKGAQSNKEAPPPSDLMRE
jgi:hypothetical protein